MSQKPLNRKCRRCINQGKLPLKCGAENCEPYKSQQSKELKTEIKLAEKFVGGTFNVI